MISIIVAIAKNGVIGTDGHLPWHLPEDLKYFKRITKNQTVVMGRKTYESIGKPLPKRRNIILTRDRNFIADGCEIFTSVDEILKQDNNLFIIGGSQVYNLFLPMTNMLYITKVDAEINGDVNFTEINEDEWELISEDKKTKDEKHQFDYSFMIYRRKEK